MAEEIPATELRPRAVHTWTPAGTTYQELTFGEGPPVARLPDWVKVVEVYSTADVRVAHHVADGATLAAVTESYQLIPIAAMPFRIDRRDGMRILLSGSAEISVALGSA